MVRSSQTCRVSYILSEPTGVMHDLTAFQRDILYVVAGLDNSYGLGIKRGLEGYYHTEINHGRLYPNLDSLVERGLLEKSALDKRTNLYTLTDEGYESIRERRSWEDDNVGEDEAEAGSSGRVGA
jgi:DNA-binding PadR family transcriptional regulator